MKVLTGIAILLLLMAATGAIAFTAWDLHQTQTSLRQTTGDLDLTLKRINSATGPITETDKLLLALKSTVVHADLVIAHEDQQLSKYNAYVANIAGDVSTLARRVGNVADASTELANSASSAVRTANDTIRAAQPLLASLNTTAEASARVVTDTDALVADPHVRLFMAHLDGTMDHVEGITGSLDKMGIHLEKQVDAPPTVQSRIKEWLEPAAKVGIWYVTK